MYRLRIPRRRSSESSGGATRHSQGSLPSSQLTAGRAQVLQRSLICPCCPVLFLFIESDSSCAKQIAGSRPFTGCGSHCVTSQGVNPISSCPIFVPCTNGMSSLRPCQTHVPTWMRGSHSCKIIDQLGSLFFVEIACDTPLRPLKSRQKSRRFVCSNVSM